MSVDSPNAKLAGGPWFHTIDLPDGSCTPGMFDLRGCSARLDWPSLEGRRCLDVGTCDGFWAFEMERRGAAEVVAIDVDDPAQLDIPPQQRDREIEVLRKNAVTRRHRFELAAAARASRACRVGCSVYDLDPATHGRFDVVLCGTLLLHLREPVRALQRIASVCRGELLLVEPVDARLDLLRRRVPCARLEPAAWQWWRHNTAGLHAVLRQAGFEVVSTSPPFSTPMGSAASSSVRSRLTRLQAPALVRLAGLVLGSYDVAIRARPREGVTAARA